MALIQDVSPTLSNTWFEPAWLGGPGFAFASGRMLSVAASEDGTVVFAGSLDSDIWISESRGQLWAQIEWPQPAAGQFGVPGALGGSCVPDLVVAPDSARWSVGRDPRLLADITGSGHDSIVGFGDTGVWTALCSSAGAFDTAPRFVLSDFGYEAGGWQVDKHPRFVAPVTESGFADIVGFGDAGVYVALSNGDGTFQGAQLVIDDFGYEAGGWRVDKHPRFLAPLTDSGLADIVGFGDAGVYVALANGDGTFQPPQLAIADFGYAAGGWRVDKHPRFLVDITGDGVADIVGFGDAGVYVALNNGDGTFQAPQFALADFGYSAGGWRIDTHPRLLGQLTGSGFADIVGFGNAGVWTALGNGDGTFQPPELVLADFGYQAGGWQVDKHPRLLGGVTSSGFSDIVGFGDAGVYVARSNGDGTFQPAQLALADFGYDAGGWRTEEHPRILARLTSGGLADIVGFGDAGVYVALANGDGTFQPPAFAPPFFGIDIIVLALVRNDRESNDAGIWRSSDRGQTWMQVHEFPRGPNDTDGLGAAGQLAWAPDTANVVYAAGGTALAVSRDAGMTFSNEMPLGPGSYQPVWHVAVAPAADGTAVPEAVYALSPPQMFVSLNGGPWMQDQTTLPRIGGRVGMSNSQAAKVAVVSPRSPFDVFATADAVNSATDEPGLFRGDYSQFASTQASVWTSLPLPDLGQQYSGDVFVEVTRPGNGDVLFYSPNHAQVFATSVNPELEFPWHTLDSGQTVHVDLHGIYLSHDFQARFDFGYRHVAGTMWMTSDGGVHTSENGGESFDRGRDVNTLSCVNIAGVAKQGTGPVLSLNTGDNDGFASPDGGAHWHRQQYGGGDNDCSFADPLRSHSMLIFTPRWDEHGSNVAAKQGNTLALYENSPGSLPDVGAESGMRHMVPGPPLHPGSVLWNASSGFGLRGFRPIVQNLPSDDPTEPGDYVFIRFFGNLATDTAQYPNNLAILLRTRHVRDIAKRTDWNTPGGWRVDKHPRLLADITGDGKADIVGFGDAGVWTALANGDGTFQTPQFVLADLGYEAGSWRVDKHPRLLARLTDSGFADIVGFGDAGVYVAFSNGDGTFQTPQLAVTDFGYDAGGWRVDKHPRYVVDITGDGKADLVGFGDAGVYVALNNGDGTFQPPHLAIGNFGYDQHWRTNQHPRFLAHLTNSGYADIVGFGTDGVWTALGNGTGAFSEPNANPVLANFGTHQNWQVDKHPRLMAPLTNSGFDDIVGFGTDGVFVALSNGDGTFNEPHANPVLANFGTHQNWQVDKHPRLMAPLTNSGFDDIVGFGTDGVFVALSNGDGTFNEPHPNPVLPAFGYHQGWRVQNHLRFLADITGDDKADIVGFGNDGVWAAPSSGDGAFTQPQTATQSPLFVIPNFGYDASGPVELQGPFLPAVDAGVVQAAGGHERTVFYLGGDKHNRLWKWSAGITNWQQLIPTGRSAKTQVTSARRFFANPYRSNNIYVLDAHHVFRSDDSGQTWTVDANLEQQLTCDHRIPVERDGDYVNLILTDMQFDPRNPQRRFAVGLGGAFITNDGVNWERLLDTEALRGRPANCYFDNASDPKEPALYVSFAGRSIVKISGF